MVSVAFYIVQIQLLLAHQEPALVVELLFFTVVFTCAEHLVHAVVRASVCTRLSGRQRQFSGAAYSTGMF
jgi:hypothetical protein